MGEKEQWEVDTAEARSLRLRYSTQDFESLVVEVMEICASTRMDPNCAVQDLELAC